MTAPKRRLLFALAWLLGIGATQGCSCGVESCPSYDEKLAEGEPCLESWCNTVREGCDNKRALCAPERDKICYDATCVTAAGNRFRSLESPAKAATDFRECWRRHATLPGSLSDPSRAPSCEDDACLEKAAEQCEPEKEGESEPEVDDTRWLPKGPIVLLPGDVLGCVNCASDKCKTDHPNTVRCYSDSTNNPACPPDPSTGLRDCCVEYRQCVRTCLDVHASNKDGARAHATCVHSQCDERFPKGRAELAELRACMDVLRSQGQCKECP